MKMLYDEQQDNFKAIMLSYDVYNICSHMADSYIARGHVSHFLHLEVFLSLIKSMGFARQFIASF